MTIISMPPVVNFHELPLESAKEILYENVLASCEKQHVYLSSMGTASDLEIYILQKTKEVLFSVEKVQALFAQLVGLQKVENFEANVYQIKHALGSTIQNGDLFAALLLRGFKIQFTAGFPDCVCNASVKAT